MTFNFYANSVITTTTKTFFSSSSAFELYEKIKNSDLKFINVEIFINKGSENQSSDLYKKSLAVINIVHIICIEPFVDYID